MWRAQHLLHALPQPSPSLVLLLSLLQVCEHLQAIAKPAGVWVVPIVGGISTEKQERLLGKRPEVRALGARGAGLLGWWSGLGSWLVLAPLAAGAACALHPPTHPPARRCCYL